MGFERCAAVALSVVSLGWGSYWNERLSVVGHLMEAVHKINLHAGMGGGRHDYGGGARSEEQLIEEHQVRSVEGDSCGVCPLTKGGWGR